MPPGTTGLAFRAEWLLPNLVGRCGQFYADVLDASVYGARA